MANCGEENLRSFSIYCKISANGSKLPHVWSFLTGLDFAQPEIESGL